METSSALRCRCCDAENRIGAAFCNACGEAIVPSCGSCGRANTAGSRFCDGCGKPLGQGASYTPAHLGEDLLSKRSAIEGERKQVTVFFCDLAASMDLAARVDAEQWHDILDRLFALLTEAVHRFEGTVNQYTGDGVMALFGAPIAHEDHAARAARAALEASAAAARYGRELEGRLGLPFQIRVGLHSGDVVVGQIGDGLRMDYTAQGHAVGLAARMESLAAPGTILLTDTTARLLGESFELADGGEREVKGAEAPIRVWRLEGERRRRRPLAIGEHAGRALFGRAAELATVDAAMAEAWQGRGRAIEIVGDAGIGKSRLCAEVLSRAAKQGARVFAVGCPIHARISALRAAVEFFRCAFGIQVDDAAAVARAKVRASPAAAHPAVSVALPLLFELLSVAEANPDPVVQAMDPESKRQRLLATVAGVLDAQTERDPVLFVFDDLQWIDAPSVDFVVALIAAARGRRALVLVNRRSGSPGEWRGAPELETVTLGPLDIDSSRALLQERGAAVTTPIDRADVTERIIDRAGGNPLYVEELVRWFDEGPGGGPERDRELPPTIHALLSARIDRLPEAEKHLLQVAAVIGRHVRVSLLGAVSGLGDEALARLLDGLLSRAFLVGSTATPSDELAFAHPLLHEATYDSQLKKHRRRLHRAVAEALEASEDADVHAATVAHHWESAGEDVRAAGAHASAAVLAGVNAPGAALHHWRRVRELLGDEFADPLAAGLAVLSRAQILNFSWRMGATEAEADAVFHEGKALAEREGDEASLVILHIGYGAVRGLAGAIGLYREHASEASRFAARVGDPGLLLATAVPLAYSLFLSGEVDALADLVERHLASPPEDLRAGASVVGFSPYAWLHAALGMVRALRGDFAGSSAAHARAVALAEELDDPLVRCVAHANHVPHLLLVGEVAEARRVAEVAFEIAEESGAAFLRAWSHADLGRALVASGDVSRGRELIESALRIATAHRTGLELEARMLGNLAEAELAAGRLDEALELASKARDLARERGALLHEQFAQDVLARIAERRGDTHGALEALAAARSLADRAGAPALIAALPTLRSRAPSD